MEIYTIGFTKTSAHDFFAKLRKVHIGRLIDVRLHNVSQLSGFAKRDDLSYFLHELVDAEYVHEPLLAPTAEMLDDYRKRRIRWPEYEERFRALMAEREIEARLDPSMFEVPTVLLCSEATAEHCHRRLVVAHLAKKWGNVEPIDL